MKACLAWLDCAGSECQYGEASSRVSETVWGYSDAPILGSSEDTVLIPGWKMPM
ncbi:hypothetical protein AS9A_2216 [Hoyosella subflava DQS3-9A1]|uniref:Uncharacterized protein n=1 Tax=Hoyosella subflava (strain DSM 45089 / JCM 17490 / NBRC 109087 / DQS3-9A1) TaxID=443218 RepID=F6EQI0_HOYSD|nr:hypothetical protein AS9A_2216 [Hoyosella subflava DQS3-9A1]